MADELAARFAAELTEVDGTPHRGADPVAVALVVAGSAPTTVAIDDDEALEPIASALGSAGHIVLRPHDATYRAELPSASLGVTRCAAAIAETGTLMLTFDASHPRSTSLLPRNHLAIVAPSDLVATLGDALARVPSPAPSALTFVTGPSRSADIEQLLTLGVHGPARVHVVLPDGAP